MTDKEDVIEHLEAQAEVLDTDIEDLTLVAEDDYQETQERIESLEEENENLEDEMEELRGEVDEVKELYADSLGEATGLEPDFFMDKELDELKELHEEKVDEEVVDSPDIKSGDVTEDNKEEQNSSEKEDEVIAQLNEQFDDDLRKYSRTTEIESVDELREIVDTFEGRGGIWSSAAEPYREALNELTAE